MLRRCYGLNATWHDDSGIVNECTRPVDPEGAFRGILAILMLILRYGVFVA
jgi:hypothetical protein